MSARLDWIEKAALENLRSHVQSTDTLAKEAATTLTILMAALSGAFSFAIQTTDYKRGAIALTAYLFVLCGVLVERCLLVRPLPPPTNEPRNLDQLAFDLDTLRTVELKNIQNRIDQAAERNSNTARWLNMVRLAAIASPALFVLVTLALA